MKDEQNIAEVNLNEFKKDFKEMFNDCSEIISASDDMSISVYHITEKLKTKYENIKITNKNSNTEFEREVIQIFKDFQSKCKRLNKPSQHISVLYELYEFLPKLYNTDKFVNVNSKELSDLILSANKNEEILLNIFRKIGSGAKNENNLMNDYLDELISSVITNTEGKILFISNNLLTINKNNSSFLSMKLILLNLIIFSKIKINNHKFFSISLSNIGTLLIPESNLFSKKMNLELYDNAFADFEFRSEDDNKRNLDNEEFCFLLDNFFLIIILIIETLTPKQVPKFSLIKTNHKLFGIIENSIEGGKTKIENEEEAEIYKVYILTNFICDVQEFIFSNLHYLDENFKNEKEIHINVNPFIVYKEKIQPKHYDNFLNKVTDLFAQTFPDCVNLIEVFLRISDLKSICESKIKEIEKNEDSSYFIFEPFNAVGISLIIWILWKKQKEDIYHNSFSFFPITYSDLYLLDIFLPICSALMKRGQNFKFMGLELLFDFLNILNEEILTDMRLLKHYSFEDVFKDLLQFIGGPDPESKRIFISKNILKFVKVLSNEAKKELYLFMLKDILKENTSNVNDAEANFVIITLKNFLTEEIKRGRTEGNKLFDESFLKEIIDISITEKLFVIDILETISQGLNFAHFLIRQDKLVFNNSLNICNKTYLYNLEKKIEMIASLVEKWVRSNDEEKMKNVRVDTSDFSQLTDLREKKEELQRSFEMRKNQALICLSLVSTLKILISDCLNKL